MGFWEWLTSEPDDDESWPYDGFWDRGGDFDLALWLLIPGYILFDEAGRRARWPHTYAAKDRRKRALKHGAIRDNSNIGHNIIDPWCQYACRDYSSGETPCEKCYPARVVR